MIVAVGDIGSERPHAHGPIQTLVEPRSGALEQRQIAHRRLVIAVELDGALHRQSCVVHLAEPVEREAERVVAPREVRIDPHGSASDFDGAYVLGPIAVHIPLEDEAPRQHGVAERELRIERDGLLQQLDALLILPRHEHGKPPLLQIELVGIGIGRRYALDPLAFLRRERGPQRARDTHGNVALDVEDVGDRAIVPFAPHRLAARRREELHADTDLRAGLPHGAGEHGADAEVARHVGKLPGGILESRHGIPANHAQRANLGQLQGHFLRDARGELRPDRATDAVERQHRDAARLRQGCRRRGGAAARAPTPIPASCSRHDDHDRRNDDAQHGPRTSFRNWRWYRASRVLGDGIEREAKIRCRLKPVARVFLETSADDARKRLGHCHERGNVRRVDMEGRVQCVNRRVTLKCAPAGQHLVKDAAEREKIGAMIDRISTDLFG